MPRAYIDTILSSKSGKRRWYLAISLGSKVPARSRGMASVTCDWPVSTVFFEEPLRRGVAFNTLILEMLIKLDIQNALRQRLPEIVQKPILGKNLVRVMTGKQLVQKFLLDSHVMIRSFPSLWP